MAKLTLGDTVDDLVDRIYGPDNFTVPDGDYTQGDHRRATSKVKRNAKQHLTDGKTIGEALTEAIREDTKDNPEWKLPWLTGLLAATAEEMAVDLGTTEQMAKQAHHDMIDRERVFHGSIALQALAAMEDLDDGQRCIAQVVVLFYMNARAVFDEDTNKRTKGAVEVAGEKALAYNEQQLGDMSDDERAGLEFAINVGRQALVDAIKQSRPSQN